MKPADIPLDRWLSMRWAQLDSEFATWRGQAADIAKYFVPGSGRFTTDDRNRGGDRAPELLDNTSTRCANILAAGLLAGATSPARPWLRLRPVDESLRKSPASADWSARATRGVLDCIARSNLYSALRRVYEELPQGTAVMLLERDDESIVRGRTLPMGQYRVMHGWDDRPNVLYRKLRRTVGEVVAHFGVDKVSAATRTAYQAGHLGGTVEIVHAIEPREGEHGVSNMRMPWRSVYFEQAATGHTGVTILRESGFERFPALIVRWSRIEGDVYGRGPGHEALGDAKQLQVTQKLKQLLIEHEAEPALLLPPSMKAHDVDRLPGGASYVDDPAKVRRLFESRADLNPVLEDIRDVRERIRASFFVDLFLMLATQDTRRMTAHEVAVRHEERLLQLGPLLESLHTELLTPLVQFVFSELLERGMLPEPPAELVDADIEIEFTSTLAQAQRIAGVTAMERALSVVTTASAIVPEIVDNIEPDEVFREVVDAFGVEPRTMRHPRKRDEIRAARAQAQAAAATANVAETATSAVRNVAQADPSGQSVMQLFQGYEIPAPQAR